MKWTLMMLTIWLAIGCGVKGDPVPPERPTELGRGRPTYKRALRDLELEPVPQNVEDEEDDDEETEE